jgi:hypothetical protein
MKLQLAPFLTKKNHCHMTKTMTIAMRLILATLLLSSLSLVQGLVTSNSIWKTTQVSHTARGFNNFFKKPSEPETTASKQPEEPEFVDGAYDEDDPVEKIFGFFFGKREEAPLGLCKSFCC